MKFEELKRQPTSFIADYILEFETPYQKIEKLERKLADSVQAYKLLHGACLQTSERQMVLATTKSQIVRNERNAQTHFLRRASTDCCRCQGRTHFQDPRCQKL